MTHAATEVLANRNSEMTVRNSIRQLVQIAAKHVKYPSNQTAVSRFCAAIASRIVRDLNLVDLKIDLIERCMTRFVQIAATVAKFLSGRLPEEKCCVQTALRKTDRLIRENHSRRTSSVMIVLNELPMHRITKHNLKRSMQKWIKF